MAALGILAQPVALASPACDVRVNDTADKLLECVTLDGVREHQAAFQAIANANGGTRASGTPGYDASLAYVVDNMSRAGYLGHRGNTPERTGLFGGTLGPA